MKSFVTKCLVFISITVPVYCLLVLLWGKLAPYYVKNNLEYRIPGFMPSRIADANRTNEVDILFLGSSHTYRGFDPRVFQKAGFTSFNLGSSSQTPIQTLALFEKYADILKPKLVLLEVHPELFGLDGLESNLDVLANASIDWPMLKMASKVNNMKNYNTVIYFGLSQLLNWPEKISEDPVFGVDKYAGRGYVERELAYNENTGYGQYHWTMLPKQVEALKELLSLAKEKGYPIVMIWAPISKGFYNSFDNNEEVTQFFKIQGEFINFNENGYPIDDRNHFYNADHLNQIGVEAFNGSLIEMIKKADSPFNGIKF